MTWDDPDDPASTTPRSTTTAAIARRPSATGWLDC